MLALILALVLASLVKSRLKPRALENLATRMDEVYDTFVVILNSVSHDDYSLWRQVSTFC